MDYDALRAQAADTLADLGEFPQPWMRTAFEQVPRHLFVPETVWIGEGHEYRAFTRDEDPQRWARMAYDPTHPVVTQVDDGTTPPGKTGALPSSSLSAPTAVFTMLHALDPQPGERVLEIGTATGYNAALLAQRAGTAHVTSIEVDPTLCAQARAALATAGYRAVHVVCGDGELGHAPHAPYDRILSTASVLHIPARWIEQTTPGGRIVTPFQTAFCPTGMITLTADDSSSAEGHFSGGMRFMTLRGQRHHTPITELFTDQAWQSRRARDLDPAAAAEVAVLDDEHATFAIGLRLPGVAHWSDGTGRWLCSTDSWALVDEDSINQWGPRHLLDEALQAATWWDAHGRPELFDFGLTVTKDGSHRAWLHTPHGPGWKLSTGPHRQQPRSGPAEGRRPPGASAGRSS